MAAIRAERDYVVHEDFMKVSILCMYCTLRNWWMGIHNPLAHLRFRR
jgi:hypothetical protein